MEIKNSENTGNVNMISEREELEKREIQETGEEKLREMGGIRQKRERTETSKVVRHICN
jgi:hypothetical protein